jgi:NADPH:quinone reductase-like Zn-dependent oxidoreductase
LDLGIEADFMLTAWCIVGEIPGLGAYSHYCVADEKISFCLPRSILREQASTVPLAATTAWLALFSKTCLGIERVGAKGTSILVWGGSCKFAFAWISD